MEFWYGFAIGILGGRLLTIITLFGIAVATLDKIEEKRKEDGV